MAAVTGTKALATEFAGDYKLVKVTFTPTSASDTVTLTAVTHGISEIAMVIPKLNNPNTGAAGACADIYATYSDLTITCVTSTSAGAAATNWAGVTAELLVIGR